MKIDYAINGEGDLVFLCIGRQCNRQCHRFMQCVLFAHGDGKLCRLFTACGEEDCQQKCDGEYKDSFHRDAPFDGWNDGYRIVISIPYRKSNVNKKRETPI